MIRCCKDCQDRQVGCHSTCERYIAEKAQYDKDQQAYKDMMRSIPTISKGSWLGDSGVGRGRRKKK